MTIIGIAPPGFFGESVGSAPDVWLPLSLQALRNPFFQLRALGRRSPGITDAQAEAALSALYQHWVDSLPVPFKYRYQIKLEPGSKGLEETREQFSRPLWVLMGIVGVILLITCCNLAGLLLARATARRHEIGLRLALGASRKRIIRQLLVESLLPSCMGGGVGIVVAAAGIPVLLGLVSDPNHPYVLAGSLHQRVLAFAACLSVATCVFFGLIPALQATVVDLNLTLKGNVGQLSESLHRRRLAKGIVAVQVALSLVLLVGSTLLIRSLHSLYQVDSGFRREGLMLVNVPLMASVRLTKKADMQRDLLDHLNALPGVRGVGLATLAPVIGGTLTQEVSFPGHSGRERVGTNYISPGYFETVGTELLQGRDFTPLDRSASPKVAVINRTMSRRCFGDESPVGKLIAFGPTFDPKDAVQIVGVVEDAKYRGLRGPNQPFAFLPLAQRGAPILSLAIRTAGDPIAFLGPIRRALHRVDSELAMSELSTLDQIIERTLVQERLMTKLCTAFGLLALTLTCVGLYGTMSYGVARRIPEIGIRMALGACRGDALRLVLREAGLLVLVGLTLGVPAALTASRLLRNLVFGLATTDPSSYVMAAAILVLVSLTASYLPALRASRVDPAVALRNE